MSNLKELKTQIENANALGIENLAKYGVIPMSRPSVTGVKPPSTYDIMNSISLIKSGASLNIAYGEEPPEDTSKLWIKANEPEKVTYSGNIDGVSRVVSGGNYLTTDYSSDTPYIAKLGTKIYIFRGIYVWIYDTDTKFVSNLGGILPDRMYDGYCFVEDNKIYLFGASKSKSYIFDPETLTTTAFTTSTINNSAVNCGYSKIGNKLYVFGGIVSYPSNYISVLDLETKTVNRLSATLPVSISSMSCETVGNKVYIFGGRLRSSNSNAIYVFDSETQIIETLETILPEPCYSMCSCRIGNKIYLFGGNGDNGRVNTIQVFDVETETIEILEATLPKPDSTIGCYGEGTKIYLFGGYDYGETINIFVLTHELQQGNIEIETAPLKNKFNIINDENTKIEIGVENVYVGNENNEAERVNAYLYKHLEETKVDKRYTSKCFQTTSGTSLTADVDCSVGDLVVASIITRDTLTLSDGWTLISTSEVNSTDTTNGQRLSFAYKYAESTNESITVTQASSQRLYINMVALQGATGFVDNGYNYVDSEASSITVAKPSGLTLWGCSSALWASSSPYPQWESSNDAPRFDLGTETQSRLAVFLDQSNDTEVTFTPADSSTIIVGSLTIQGMDAFYTEEFKEWDEWVQISFGKEPEEEPTGTYSERMYNHFGVDIAEFPYLLIRVKDALAYAFFFTGRETDSLGNYVFTTVRDLQIEIDDGADISAIIKEFESRDSSALLSAVSNMESTELEGYTYYANFDYAELGYSGVGTWETLE